MKIRLKKMFIGRTRLVDGFAINGLNGKWRVVMKTSQPTWPTSGKYDWMKMRFKKLCVSLTRFAARPAIDESV
jgi:hypothetical protein